MTATISIRVRSPYLTRFLSTGKSQDMNNYKSQGDYTSVGPCQSLERSRICTQDPLAGLGYIGGYDNRLAGRTYMYWMVQGYEMDLMW